jgi:thymidylate synthase ThyX
MIKAEIASDSINPKDCRLTTFVLEYNRHIHAELLTHRVFSKNAASSRAIPIEKMIQQIIDNPAMPVHWGKNQSGMQAKEELDNITKSIYSHTDGGGIVGEYDVYVTPMDYCKHKWLEARDKAIVFAREMNKAGLHKQLANRCLETWFNIRVILTGTEFENFFALRDHPDAQPEIQVLAEKMLTAYNDSEPKSLNEGDWHIPFGDKIDSGRLMEAWKAGNQIDGLVELKKKIAVARCARVSYFNFEGKDDYVKDIETCDKLFGSVPRHLSPAEHVAQCLDSNEFNGNFRGFKQYRKFFPQENLSDSRVVKKKWKIQHQNTHDNLENAPVS